MLSPITAISLLPCVSSTPNKSFPRGVKRVVENTTLPLYPSDTCHISPNPAKQPRMMQPSIVPNIPPAPAPVTPARDLIDASLARPKRPLPAPRRYRCSDEFYLSDGDIVIIIDMTFFCVHRDSLDKWEGSFNSLYEATEPATLDRPFIPGEGNASLVNVELCHLSVVSAEEFTYYLRAVYYKEYLDKLYDDEEFDWTANCALMRYARKMNCGPLLDATVESFKMFLFAERDHGRKPRLRASSGHTGEVEKYWPIQAINIAEEYSLSSTLPWAYYYASQSLNNRALVFGTHCPHSRDLSALERWRILEGKQRLDFESRGALFHFLSTILRSEKLAISRNPDGTEDNESHTSCSKAFTDIINDLFSYDETDPGPRSPLFASSLVDKVKHQVCPTCWTDFDDAIKMAEKGIFQKLSTIFDLRHEWRRALRE